MLAAFDMEACEDSNPILRASIPDALPIKLARHCDLSKSTVSYNLFFYRMLNVKNIF